jgi:acyl-homoserine-lactone acylase
MDPEELRESFRYINEYQLKHFGRTGVPLGELQRHRRGTKDLPAWGLPDVLSAMYSSPEKDGRFRVVAGESYIEMVRFPKNSLPVIESINCYGSSSKPESRHYNDQMEIFLQQKTRSISIDKQTNLNTASRIYSPATADR